MSFGESLEPLAMEGFTTDDPLLSLVDRKKIHPEALVKLNKKRYAAWVLYDVANTFYASGILSFISLTWILVIGQEQGYSYGSATTIYSIVISAASIFMAILLPILGSMSDVTQQRKNYVVFFTTICLLSTYLFVFLDSFWPVIIVFAISMVAYQWAQVFYDAMLPGIVPPGREARLSSIAITIGYLGGAAITAYAWLLSQNSEEPNADPSEGAITLGYSEPMAYAVIIGFTLLAIPIFFVREQNWEEISKLVFLDDMDEWQAIYHAFMLEEIDEEPDKGLIFARPVKSSWRVAKESLQELYRSFKDIYHNHHGFFFYIVAYFIIADLANLIALINITYLRDSIQLDDDEIFKLIWISGVSLVIITPIIGSICDKYGAKNGYKVVGSFWFIALTIMIFEGIVFPRNAIYIAAAFIGPALAGVWVAQRQMVLELVPNDEEIGRYFGMTKFSGKLSSAIGPLLFASTFLFVENWYDGDELAKTQVAYRWSIASLTVFLAIGFWILMKFVPDQSKEFRERKKRISEILDTSDTIGKHQYDV
ncbi:MAG: MFS transporter [Candidatus Kariarchaeaceae archaeon]|jgi:UMF1 family MFS transporter